jgi:hypothetical protein
MRGDDASDPYWRSAAMAVLNLLVSAILMALGLFRPDGDGGAGGGTATATPPATGDTQPPASGSTTSTTTTTAAPATPSAEGDEDPAGRGSKAAVLADLARERGKRQELETEVAALRERTQTDAEKAVANARKEAANERDQHWSNGARAAAWRAALTAAGLSDASAIAVPSEVAQLKVDPDTFTVEGIDKVAKQFRADHPSLFVATTSGGSADQGPRGSAPPKPTTFADAVTARVAGGSSSTS